MRKRTVKRAILFAIPIIVVSVVAFRTFFAFHPSRRFISRSPVGSHVVDFVPGGFVDLSYDFRAHDLGKSLFHPIIIGDLVWKQRYFSANVFWSRDGSVAAASIVLYPDRREVMACAYDFTAHRALRSGSPESPLDDSCDPEIRRLLVAHGGYTQLALPEPKEL